MGGLFWRLDGTERKENRGSDIGICSSETEKDGLRSDRKQKRYLERKTEEVGEGFSVLEERRPEGE